MDANVSCDVNDLFGRDRESLEHLLGTALSPSQRVYVMAFTPGTEPDASSRNLAANTIEALLDKSAAYASVQAVTDSQIDEAVDEAMSKIRPRNPI